MKILAVFQYAPILLTSYNPKLMYDTLGKKSIFIIAGCRQFKAAAFIVCV